MPRIDISPDRAATQISAWLAAAESQTLEFKRIKNGGSKAIDAICAFANTNGGVLVIGIGDAKDLKPGDKPESRLYGIEEKPEDLTIYSDRRCIGLSRLLLA